MLARRKLRLTVADALRTIPNVGVDTPGDWPTAEQNAPEIKCRAPHETKDGIAKAVTEFNTTTTIEIEARLQAATAEDAQDQIEELGDQIENAVFCSLAVIKLIQQVKGVASTVEINSEALQHLAALRMQIQFEVFESFDAVQVRPVEYPALQQIGLHADLISKFDASGTYSSPAFPASVKPAPRTSGPDGRDEGALEIDLPQ